MSARHAGQRGRGTIIHPRQQAAGGLVLVHGTPRDAQARRPKCGAPNARPGSVRLEVSLRGLIAESRLESRCNGSARPARGASDRALANAGQISLEDPTGVSNLDLELALPVGPSPIVRSRGLVAERHLSFALTTMRRSGTMHGTVLQQRRVGVDSSHRAAPNEPVTRDEWMPHGRIRGATGCPSDLAIGNRNRVPGESEPPSRHPPVVFPPLEDKRHHDGDRDQRHHADSDGFPDCVHAHQCAACGVR